LMSLGSAPISGIPPTVGGRAGADGLSITVLVVMVVFLSLVISN
jgi:hypothetical protein